jgi:hypothetical protein
MLAKKTLEGSEAPSYLKMMEKDGSSGRSSIDF